MRLKDVYRQNAKKNGVTEKDEMQRSIDEAWNDPQNNGIIRAYQNRVPCRGATPTSDELLCYLAGIVGGKYA